MRIRGPGEKQARRLLLLPRASQRLTPAAHGGCYQSIRQLKLVPIDIFKSQTSRQSRPHSTLEAAIPMRHLLVQERFVGELTFS